MADGTTFVGLDVHVATIAVAVGARRRDGAGTGGDPEHGGGAGQTAAQARAAGDASVCYEAGPCGYGIYRQLTELGMACTVAAPSLIPVRPGDRVKTDRRDAAKLARLLRSGDLTAVAVPTPEQEALRALSRARETAIGDRHRARQRLVKFLARTASPNPLRHPLDQTYWALGAPVWRCRSRRRRWCWSSCGRPSPRRRPGSTASPPR